MMSSCMRGQRPGTKGVCSGSFSIGAPGTAVLVAGAVAGAEDVKGAVDCGAADGEPVAARSRATAVNQSAVAARADRPVGVTGVVR
jgi:hypothetical protein